VRFSGLAEKSNVAPVYQCHNVPSRCTKGRFELMRFEMLR
jgi:hypothetical protein